MSLSLFSPRSSSPSESKKPSWRFFSSSTAPPVPTLPTQPIPSPPRLRTSVSASAIPLSTSARGHYRTHSSLAKFTPASGTDFSPTLGSGAQVVRTPSEARRGIMKVRQKAVPRPTIAQSADLPMMEECDRRVSLSITARAPSSAPLGTEKGLHKSSCMATVGNRDRDENRKSSRRSHIIPSSARDSERTHRATFIPPSIPTSVPTQTTVPFSAALLDITQKPAPTSSDQILVKLESGFSLDERSNTSTITLPYEILQRGGGLLGRFVQGHLEEMKDRADQAADEEDRIRIVSDVPSFGSKPGMTDGDSASESDLDSEEYGSSALLRDEYLKSLWAPSPTAFSAFSEAQVKTVKSDITSRESKYYTPPKNRAYVRNQYTQHSPYPTPTSPFIPQTAPLALRRRARYLVLPSTEPRGSIIEIKLLLMRDAGCWHLIAARLVKGSWSRMDERKAQGVIEELKWAGMDNLLAELRPVRRSSEVKVAEPETPPVPKLEDNGWMEKRQRRMSSKSIKGDLSGIKSGGMGYL